jgi:hypothetical protein
MQPEVDMTDYDKKSPAGDSRNPATKKDGDSIIPGRHGKHGGGLESEGAPQEPSPEANKPPEHNGADRMRH